MVSTNDRAGGAAIGAYRLHQALQRAGIESEMLVLRKVTSDPHVHRLSSYFNRGQRARRRLAEWRHRRRLVRNPRQAESEHWSLNLFRLSDRRGHQQRLKRTCGASAMGWRQLLCRMQELAKIKAPIVWTLQDMWAFTGGCHYTLAAVQSIPRELCGDCPQLIAHRGQGTSAIGSTARSSAAWSETVDDCRLLEPSGWRIAPGAAR